MPAQSARFAVIGRPIAHSRSPEIHAMFAEQAGIDLTYERIEAQADGFADCVHHLRARGFRGVNVTLPFKEDALRVASNATPRALRAGAANTLTIDGQRIEADNTDGAGLLRDLAENLGKTIAGCHILLLGAGGAARGVLQPLLDANPAGVVIANRTQERAMALAALGDARVHAMPIGQAGERAFDLIINATSASLQGSALPVPAACFHGKSLAYDMMYGAQPTGFMRQAAARGVRVADGLGMLVEQAAEAFFGWHGVRPATAPVILALRRALTA
ncbi:MAG: shikimate dehydrogenase [Betaproteobacteria bacterium]|nr:shikimate dehydrogenase [Betaproteobacteria bacterium]